MQDYLNDPGIGSGTLNYISYPYTPADFKANVTSPYFKGSPSANLGTFIHSKVLEPATFDDLYIYEPLKIDKRSTAGKEKAAEFAKAAEGKIVIPFCDRVKIEAAAEAVGAHEELKGILSQGNAEITGVAYFAKHLTPDGLRFKTREDWLTDDGYVYDIKTLSEHPTDDNLAKTIQKYAYHFKAVHHMEVLRRCGVDVKGFRWVFITTHLPTCHVVVKSMSLEMEAIGKALHSQAIGLLAHCTKTNTWPGYSQTIEPIELPSWVNKGVEL